MTGPAPAPSDAILTIPNLLSAARLALIPVVLWLALVRERMGLAVLLAAIGFVTDLVDGKIARRFGQVSKLGVALDPLSDRLSLAAGAWILIAHDLTPVWAVLVVLVRDALLVVVGAPALKALGVPIPPVSRVGKYGSFAISACFALFLASGIESLRDPTPALQTAAWVMFWIGVPLYYAAAGGYARVAWVSARAAKRGTARG